MTEKKDVSPEAIINEYDRMTMDDEFTFGCDTGLDCFTHCCADVSIVLTPYDVLRMKSALNISSGEFLEKYTILGVTGEKQIPILLLKMDPETKKCLLLSDKGCGIYGNRPWACRMYPLGKAEPQKPNPENRAFYFLLKEDLCHGHGTGRKLTVREWIDDQGIEAYDMMGESFKELMLHDGWSDGEALSDKKRDMYLMACFDIDCFRRFVFDSNFLNYFLVDEYRVEVMRTNDEEMLNFAMQWLRFSLFGDKTMKVNPAVAEARAKKAADGDHQPCNT